MPAIPIPLEAIKSATNDFADGNRIRGGGFGKVYKAKLLISGAPTIVALKRSDPSLGQGSSEFWTEITALSQYKHKNIVSLLAFCYENGEKILIYEYASNGSLDAYLSRDDLDWVTRLKFCIGAARGLAHLHDPGERGYQRVVHRDIKSSNILLDENWNAKIADLGLSRFRPANQQHSSLVTGPAGTKEYMCPQYFQSGLLTKESDVYSFGVVLFEVLCGRLCIDKYHLPLVELVQQRDNQNNIHEIIHHSLKGEIASRSLQEFSAIAYQCLNSDIKKRPSMTTVLSKLERALQYQISGEKRMKWSRRAKKTGMDGSS